jgi:ABC-type transporter Mla subunit MlaD
MKQAKDVLIVALLFVSLFIAGMVLRTLHDLDTLVKTSNGFVVESQTRMVGTSQNLNAILIQVGLATDNVRRASETQSQVSKKTLALLDNANDLLAHTQANTDEITLHTVQTMDAVRPVFESVGATTVAANKLLSDPNIPLILQNLNDTSKETTATMQQVTGTMANVNTTTKHIEGWVDKELKPPTLPQRIYKQVTSWLIIAAHFL